MSELWIPFLYLYCITRVREGAHMNSESCVHTFTTLPRKLPHSQIHAHQRNQYWIFIGGTDAEAEAPILWPPDVKTWLIRKDTDSGKDWRQKEKGMTEDEMVGWHHRLNGHEFEQALGDGDGQGSLASCSPWSCKELDMTEWRNNNMSVVFMLHFYCIHICYFREGNGNPLQYSCLENPMDGGAWWATYSPQGRKELDTTEWLHFHFLCIHFHCVPLAITEYLGKMMRKLRLGDVEFLH